MKMPQKNAIPMAVYASLEPLTREYIRSGLDERSARKQAARDLLAEAEDERDFIKGLVEEAGVA